MTRKETKAIMPIIQAYAEGKVIQYSHNGGNTWYDVAENVNHDINTDFYDYRIKPTPTYRPFANKDECWEEMQKHQPVGYLSRKKNGDIVLLANICVKDNSITLVPGNTWFYEDAMRFFTFADGTPFGIKEESEG